MSNENFQMAEGKLQSVGEVMDTTVTDSGGFSFHLSFTSRALIHFTEQPFKGISLTDRPTADFMFSIDYKDVNK